MFLFLIELNNKCQYQSRLIISDMQSVNGLKSNRGQFEQKSTSDELDNDFMNELNQFEFEINNERQRRHSQQRIQQFNGDPMVARNGAMAAAAVAPVKKVVRKKRQTKQRPDDELNRKAPGRGSVKSIKQKKDEQPMDEYSSSPYSSEDEPFSSGSPGYDDEFQSTEIDTPQQQFEAIPKNGHFVEATNMLDEAEQYNQQQQQQQYYAINEEFDDDGISKDGGRIVNEFDGNFDTPTMMTQAQFDAEKSSIQNVSTDIGSPSTDQTTFHKEQSLTSEMSTDIAFDELSRNEPQKSMESGGSSETSTFKSKLNKVLSHESSQDSTNGGFGSSKWKLLKTLKEKRIEEKNNQEKIKEEEKQEKSSVSTRRFNTSNI